MEVILFGLENIRNPAARKLNFLSSCKFVHDGPWVTVSPYLVVAIERTNAGEENNPLI